mgnify:CR=1 FL=1
MKPIKFLLSLYDEFGYPNLANFIMSDLDNNIDYQFGAFVLATYKDEVVLIRRQPDGKFPGIENFWWTPGGSQKDNERLDQTAIRECKEETGLLCSVQRLLVAELSKDRPFIAVTFRGSIVKGMVSPDHDPDRTTAEAKYFSKDSVSFDKLWVDSDKILLVKEKYTNGKIENLIAKNRFMRHSIIDQCRVSDS